MERAEFGIIVANCKTEKERRRFPRLMKEKKAPLRAALYGCLFVYLIAVLWYTVGCRTVGYYQAKPDLFWSYKLWLLEKQSVYGYPILANIVMFVPFGFLAAAIREKAGWKSFLLILCLACLFSFLIETLQYVLMRGCFELDDVFNNTAGALLGMALAWLTKRLLPDKWLGGFLLAAGAGTVLACAGLFLAVGDGESASLKPLPIELCFQAEEANYEENRLEISGVCFWYERKQTDYAIVLRSSRTGERIRCQTECRLARPDASAYFHRGDIQPGFHAAGQGVAENEAYEIILDFGLLREIPTGVYLTVQTAGAEIHAVPGSAFQPPKTGGADLKRIVAEGTLRVYRPDQHVFVYEKEGRLYWIAEDGFLFKENGRTHLELLLWTSDREKLSERSRALGRDHDVFAVFFEENELTGDFGDDRVCAFELPSDVPITAIKTGYYANGWVWQETFWPVFRFSAASE